MILKYISHTGQEYDLKTKGGMRARSLTAHTYEWSPNVTVQQYGDKVNRFDKKSVKYKMKLDVAGTIEERKAQLNALHAAFESDIFAMSPGKLVHGDYYVQCYMSKSETQYSKPDTENNIEVYCPYPFWIKENAYSFLPQEDTESANLCLDYGTEIEFFHNAAWFEQGAINGSTGADGDVLSNRVRTKGYFETPTGVKIDITANNCQFWVYQYKSDGAFIGYTPSSATSHINYTPAENVGRIRMVLKKSDNSNFNASDFGSAYSVYGLTDYFNGKPGDYPYDYMSQESGQGIIRNPGAGAANYRLIVYGPATDPILTIDNRTIGVYTTIAAGEYLVIDSRDNTVIRRMANGETVNLYNNRVKTGTSIFDKISPGQHSVIWAGTYGFEITVFEERSEPAWS